MSAAGDRLPAAGPKPEAASPGPSPEAASPGPADWIGQLRWNDAGLVAAVAQDAASGRVLMLAWMNREALAQTIASGRAVYFSRSRNRLWRKGEESGNFQTVREIRLDCDGDAVLLKIEQEGDVACHTGRESCFYRRFEAGEWVVVDPVRVDPGRLYK